MYIVYGFEQGLLWDKMSERCFLRRGYCKYVVHRLIYGGSVDPWLDHIVRTELNKLLDEGTP